MTAPFKEYKMVVGLTPALPVGAVATVGRRNDKGQPVDKDRFFIMHPDLEKMTFPKRDGGNYTVDGRNLHPEFKPWNDRALKGRRIMKRGSKDEVLLDLAVMRGFLAFGTIEDLFTAKKWAPELKKIKLSPPGRLPACTGNGEEAQRFARMDGEKPVYDTIECPEDCPFYGDDCTYLASLMFMPCWGNDSMPRQLMRWTTRSERSAANALGILYTAYRIGIGLGIPNPSLYGIPFEMRIAEQTSNMIAPRRFPIVSFSITTDLRDWFKAQKEEQQQLGAGGFVLGLPAPPRDDEFLLDAGDTYTLSGGEDDEDTRPPLSAASITDGLPDPDWEPTPEELAAMEAKG